MKHPIPSFPLFFPCFTPKKKRKKHDIWASYDHSLTFSSWLRPPFFGDDFPFKKPIKPMAFGGFPPWQALQPRSWTVGFCVDRGVSDAQTHHEHLLATHLLGPGPARSSVWGGNPKVFGCSMVDGPEEYGYPLVSSSATWLEKFKDHLLISDFFPHERIH